MLLTVTQRNYACTSHSDSTFTVTIFAVNTHRHTQREFHSVECQANAAERSRSAVPAESRPFPMYGIKLRGYSALCRLKIEGTVQVPYIRHRHRLRRAFVGWDFHLAWWIMSASARFDEHPNAQPNQ